MTFPDLSEGCALCLLRGRLGSGLALFWRCWTLGIVPWGAAQYKVYYGGGGGWHHTYYYLSGQLRRWGCLDLSSKAVFFSNTTWFLSLMGSFG